MKKASLNTPRSDRDEQTIKLIETIANQVRKAIESGKLPSIRMPVRSLDVITHPHFKGPKRGLAADLRAALAMDSKL